MTAAAEFIAQLQSERRGGHVSGETEQHLKHEFRKLGGNASDLILSAAVGSEINRLEREAATLRKLREPRCSPRHPARRATSTRDYWNRWRSIECLLR